MVTVWVCAAAFGVLVRGWWCVCDPLLVHAGFAITPASTVRDYSGHHAEHGIRIDETPPTESNPPARLAGWLAPIPKLGNGPTGVHRYVIDHTVRALTYRRGKGSSVSPGESV